MAARGRRGGEAATGHPRGSRAPPWLPASHSGSDSGRFLGETSPSPQGHFSKPPGSRGAPPELQASRALFLCWILGARPAEKVPRLLVSPDQSRPPPSPDRRFPRGEGATAGSPGPAWWKYEVRLPLHQGSLSQPRPGLSLCSAVFVLRKSKHVPLLHSSKGASWLLPGEEGCRVPRGQLTASLFSVPLGSSPCPFLAQLSGVASYCVRGSRLTAMHPAASLNLALGGEAAWSSPTSEDLLAPRSQPFPSAQL